MSIKSKIRARSLWIINYFTACGFIELLPWVGSGYDMERFGILAKGSPRHADVFIIAGYVTKKALPRIKRIYEQMPEPKMVVAVGSCPASGCVFYDCYNVVGPLDKFIPVNAYVPGCPPKPEAIIFALVNALEKV